MPFQIKQNDDRDLIIGGSDTIEGRYPYMASITNSTGHHQCGGTLIAPDVVLTAAHCAPIITNGGYVQIGHHSLYYEDGQEDNDDDYQIETFQVRRLVPHVRFRNIKMLRYDFLLLVLNGQSKSKPIQIINQDGSIPVTVGTSLHVMGWGRTNATSPLNSDILQEVEVKFVPNDKCESSVGFVGPMIGSYHGLIKEDHLCAIDVGEDACYGDSGGPLILKSNDGTDDDHNAFTKDVLIGIVSWGFACNHTSFPGVYSRVSTVYGWIKETVCAISSHAQESFHCAEQKDEKHDGILTSSVPSASPSSKKTSTPSSLPSVFEQPSPSPSTSLPSSKNENVVSSNLEDTSTTDDDDIATTITSYEPLCTTDNECPPNSICTLHDTKCKNLNGQSCFFDNECLYNYCNHGYCRNGGLLLGMECTKNVQCRSSKCKKGICVISGNKDKKQQQYQQKHGRYVAKKKSKLRF